MTLSECAFNIHAARTRVVVAPDRVQEPSRALKIRAHTLYTMINSRDCPPSYVILLHRFARYDGQRWRGGMPCMVAGGF